MTPPKAKGEPKTEEHLYGHAHNLHDLEPHYSRHVHAMTSEGLHHKSAIAAELAWRDLEIDRLRAQGYDLAMALAWLLRTCGKTAGTAVDMARRALTEYEATATPPQPPKGTP